MESEIVEKLNELIENIDPNNIVFDKTKKLIEEYKYNQDNKEINEEGE